MENNNAIITGFNSQAVHSGTWHSSVFFFCCCFFFHMATQSFESKKLSLSWKSTYKRVFFSLFILLSLSKFFSRCPLDLKYKRIHSVKGLSLNFVNGPLVEFTEIWKNCYSDYLFWDCMYLPVLQWPRIWTPSCPKSPGHRWLQKDRKREREVNKAQ